MENMEYVNIVASYCETLNEMFDWYHDAGINIITGGANGLGFARAVVVYDEENPNSCCIGILPADNE